MTEARECHYWLMKAEPDSRVVKGKDVKFSVSDFEAAGTTPWEGVRNHQARNIMRDSMKLGDKVLFYHSSCKVPGVTALAEVCKEAYPDHSAWDPKHPYYDAKTDKDSPRWYMVDVRFIERTKHLVPLSVLKELPDLDYLDDASRDAIKGMALINNSRLSVQPVTKLAYGAIVQMGEHGGFEVEPTKSKKRKAETEADAEAGSKPEGEAKTSLKKKRRRR